jgi:hypothetical protein
MKFTALGLLGTVGVALIWLAMANAAADSKLEKKLAELREAGQPTSLADLARKPIPPETNAATYLRRAKSDVQAIEKMIVTAGESPEVKKLQDAKASHEAIERSEPMMRAYRQAVAAHANAFPLLEQAAACPDYDPQLDYSTDTETFFKNFLPVVQDQRSAIRALRYRALVQLAGGQREEALATCLIMLRLARHFDRNPALVGFLVAIAVRMVAVDTTNLVLQSGPLPQSAYAALEAELARHDVPRAFQQMLPTARAVEIQEFGETDPGYLRLPMAKADQYHQLQLFDVLIESATQPYGSAQEKMDAVADRAGMRTELLAPALSATTGAVARSQARIRCLRVLSAILARAQTVQTDEPKLADLGLPAKATTDPFSSEPLLLKKTADGWRVYSVGPDLKDDGGELGEYFDKDIGLAPPPLPASVADAENGNQ